MSAAEILTAIAAILLPALVLAIRAFGSCWKRAEATIIALLTERPHMTGLEIVNASNGRISRGSVYVWLGLMEENGLVTSTTGAGGFPRRRLYTLTTYGHRKATTND
jgi:DNA-binding PadR family transcriptional regulator